MSTFLEDWNAGIKADQDKQKALAALQAAGLIAGVARSSLTYGQALNVNDRLDSGNGAQLVMQPDGNLVLYRTDKHRALWDSGTYNKGGVKAFLDPGGNLLIFDSKGGIVWQTNTYGHPLPVLSLGTDGNLSLHSATGPYWSTQTWNFERADEHDTWIEKAVATAGHGVGDAISAIGSTANDISHALASVPIIGPALHGAWEYSYGAAIHVAVDIADGKRIDKVALGYIDNEVKAVKEVAPYVQMVISVVPGVGPAVSGAISAGLALAEGQSITDAMLAAVKGALPGGPLVAMAFDVATAAMSGKNVASILIAALPIPDSAKKVIGTGIDIAEKLAKGENVMSVALDEAIAQLPPDAQKLANAARAIGNGEDIANILVQTGQGMIPNLSDDQRKALNTGLSTGMALGHGQKLQSIIAQNLSDPAVLGKFSAIGGAAAKANEVVSAARDLVPPEARNGFDIGVGFMSHQIGVFPLKQLRDSLPEAVRKGFDSAVSLHIGAVTTPPGLNPLPPHMTPVKPVVNVGKKPVTVAAITALTKPVVNVGVSASHAKAAYLMTAGSAGAGESVKNAVITAITSHPDAIAAASQAVKDGALTKLPWWKRMLHHLGFFNATG